ncbi:division plane positioning ATPase MipZ, partial [Neisseria sp. P0017.S004]|uniref:division plane positioning ATPase MipZ n=1 Tax=Neisseria sp. P0017.S004 TaxID=3436780 RepID=UPI003F7F2CF6
LREAAIDLDTRQATMHRYCENRAETRHRRAIDLPGPVCEVFSGNTVEELEAQVVRLGRDMDFIIFDTPGRDDPFARHVATEADTLVV